MSDRRTKESKADRAGPGIGDHADVDEALRRSRSSLLGRR
jgi:hypothetical protein